MIWRLLRSPRVRVALGKGFLLERETLVTPQGLEKVQAELDHLINVKRVEISERIKEARELGDLKENAEYHDAKNSQAFIETKINQLEDIVRTAVVVDTVDSDVVNLGTTVTVTDLDHKDSVDYQITGSAEADPMENRISLDSPIGAALAGAKVGDVVEAQLPRTKARLRIDKIALTS